MAIKLLKEAAAKLGYTLRKRAAVTNQFKIVVDMGKVV